MDFRIEKKGYDKEQVNLYIEKLSETYKSCTERNKQLEAELQNKEDEISRLINELTSLKINLELKENENLGFGQEKEKLISYLQSIEKEVKETKEENERLKNEIENHKPVVSMDTTPIMNVDRSFHDDALIIGETLLEAKAMANKVLVTANNEAELIKLSAAEQVKEKEQEKSQILSDLTDIYIKLKNIIDSTLPEEVESFD